MASALGNASRAHALEDTWEPLLFNETHDLTSGVMVDKVYEDSIQRYAHARQMAEALIRASLDSIQSRITTAGKGVPITVFNMLGWSRSDIAEVDVPFSDPNVQQFALFDPDGKTVPTQILSVLRNDDGAIRQVRIAF